MKTPYDDRIHELEGHISLRSEERYELANLRQRVVGYRAAMGSGVVARLTGVVEEVVANLPDRSGDYLAVLDNIVKHAKAALGDFAEAKGEET